METQTQNLNNDWIPEYVLDQLQMIFKVDSHRDPDWINSNYNFPDRFKEFVTNNLVCTICLKIFNQPVTLICQHTFCLGCLNQFLKVKNICPLCQKYFSKPIYNPFQNLAHLIQNLQLPCTLCFKSLTMLEKYQFDFSQIHSKVWQGTFREMPKHLKLHDFDNQQVQISSNKCKNHIYGCSFQYSSIFEEYEHQDLTCLFNWKQCLFCLQIFQKYCFNQHRCRKEEILQNQLNNRQNNEKQQTTLVISFKPSDQGRNLTIMKHLQQIFNYSIVERSNELTFSNVRESQNMIDALNKKCIFEVEILLKDISIDQNFYLIKKQSQQEDLKQTSIRQIGKNDQYCGFFKKMYNPAFKYQKKAFVSNIIAETQELAKVELYQLGSNFGKIEECKVYNRGENGRWYGHLKFKENSSLKNILNARNEWNLIKINYQQFKVVLFK